MALFRHLFCGLRFKLKMPLMYFIVKWMQRRKTEVPHDSLMADHKFLLLPLSVFPKRFGSLLFGPPQLLTIASRVLQG